MDKIWWSDQLEKYSNFSLFILSTVINSGKSGIYESEMFKLLSNNGDLSVYDYKDGLTPNKLLSSLLEDNHIEKICTKEYMECKYISTRRLDPSVIRRIRSNKIDIIIS